MSINKISNATQSCFATALSNHSKLQFSFGTFFLKIAIVIMTLQFLTLIKITENSKPLKSSTNYTNRMKKKSRFSFLHSFHVQLQAFAIQYRGIPF